MRLPRFGRPILAVATGLALLGGGLVHSSAAHATLEWCWDDPTVSIGGTQVQTQFALQADPSLFTAHESKATVTYIVPRNVSFAYLSGTDTYFREKVKVESSGAPVAQGSPIPVTVVVSFNGRTRQANYVGQLVDMVGGAARPVSMGSSGAGITDSFAIPAGTAVLSGAQLPASLTTSAPAALSDR